MGAEFSRESPGLPTTCACACRDRAALAFLATPLPARGCRRCLHRKARAAGCPLHTVGPRLGKILDTCQRTGGENIDSSFARRRFTTNLAQNFRKPLQLARLWSRSLKTLSIIAGWCVCARICVVDKCRRVLTVATIHVSASHEPEAVAPPMVVTRA